jgi:PAS domain S-box-containing protein
MTPAKILVVEDDRVVARDIQQQLRRIGHEVLGLAVRGDDAISQALQTRPDLVLMDIRLEGEIDGVEAARQIRERCYSPVVFLTAYSDDETLRRASQTEPFGYLLKPFEDSQLRTVIEIALYKHAAERKLRDSERRYATTLSSIGDAVIATDKSAHVTFLNPVAVSLTGWSQAEAAGRPISKIFQIINAQSRHIIEDAAAKALRLQRTVGPADHTLLLSKDGREFPIDDCGAPIVDDDGEITGAVLVFRDMTRRHQIDEELRDARLALSKIGRVTMIGELIVSIAREISDPLMAIMKDAAACIQFLTKEQPNIDEARQATERIIKDGHRAGDVIANISALAPKATAQMVELDMNGAILEIIMLLRSELRRHAVSIEPSLESGGGSILADRVQIQQVIMNLLMNAIEALSKIDEASRIIKIKTERTIDGYIHVSIADSGPELDPTNFERIFEAFFTTKPEGVGIGLSICRSIIETHGGHLWASKNSPQGCVLNFKIPLVV